MLLTVETIFFWVPSKVFIIVSIIWGDGDRNSEISGLCVFLLLLFYIMHVFTKTKFAKLMSCYIGQVCYCALCLLPLVCPL